MPNFQQDVNIEEHSLRLLDASDNEIARLDQDGNLVVRREFGSTLPEILEFIGSVAQLSVGAQAVPGIVRVLSGAGEAIMLRATDATVLVGGGGEAGDLVINDASGQPVITSHGASASMSVGTFGNDGEVRVDDAAGRNVIRLQSSNAAIYAGAADNEGDLVIIDSGGREVIHADGGAAALYVGTEGNEGDIYVRDNSGRVVCHMDGQNAALYIGTEGNEGDILVRDSAGRDVMHMDGNNAALYVGANGNEGDIFVRNASGTDVIHLDGNSGDIRLMGADLAEEFTSATAVEAGSVLIATGPDAVAVSETAHDRRVIGVASGAGDLKPALRLGTRPGEERVPVAIVGRVYCKADASRGPIRAGDLLTTSDIPGHAMKAADPERAFGAVIGKALAPLASGRDMIPILVALQ